MLAALREVDEDASSEKVVELLNRGVAPQSIWDALLLGAGELLVRQPGIVALARGDDQPTRCATPGIPAAATTRDG